MMDDLDVETSKISHQLTQTRNELNNIRKGLQSMKSLHKGDVQRLEELLSVAKSFQIPHSSKPINKIVTPDCIIQSKDEEIDAKMDYTVKPIGFVKSLFHHKNGTPRQGSISTLTKGRLEILKDTFNNPAHSLEGLQDYSHLWLIYLFHQNSSEGTHAKVAPPRLDGQKVGVFSTRSPHRPNAIGLTLAKLESVEGSCLHVSGIDILDGTPVLDVKPYIPQYDSPSSFSSTPVQVICKSLTDDEKTGNRNDVITYSPVKTPKLKPKREQQNPEITQIFPSSESNPQIVSEDKVQENVTLLDKLEIDLRSSPLPPDDAGPSGCSGDAASPPLEEVKVAGWVKSPPVQGLKVVFNPIAEEQIKKFSPEAQDLDYRLEYLKHHSELRSAISSVLAEDPRSTYRRQKCSDRLYFFMVDSAHITTWFAEGVVEVLRVYPPGEAASHFKLV